MLARLVFSQSCSCEASVVSRSDRTIALMLSLSSATSPSASTEIVRVMSPAATALVTSEIARTWRVRLPASSLTFSVEPLPGPGHALDLGLPAELAFPADLAGDPGDLGGER